MPQTPEVYACQFGNKEEVKELLDAGADIFMKDNNGNLPLHYLVSSNDDVEILKLFFEAAMDDLEKKQLIAAKNYAGFSPFWCAVESGHYCIAEQLEKELGSLNINYYNEVTQLEEKRGITLQSKYKKLSQYQRIDFKAFLRATESDDSRFLEACLEACTPIYNLHINAINNGGYDPLRTAISLDNVENVKYLLFSADMELTEENFLLTKDFENGKVMDVCKSKLLLEREWPTLSTPLHDVARTGNIEIFQIISQFYEDLNIRDINLQTPLHVAAANKNTEIFCSLFKRLNFSLFLNDKDGETPFSIICRKNLIDALQFVTKDSVLYKDQKRRRYFLNLAITTRCLWLLQLIFQSLDRAVQNLYYETHSEIKETKVRHIPRQPVVFEGCNTKTFEKIAEIKQSHAGKKRNSKKLTNGFSNANENIELIIKCPDDDDDEDIEYEDLPFAKTVLTQPLKIMIEYQHSLLSHPLVDSYIDMKWNRFAKWGYYGLCVYYSLIALGLTILTINVKPQNTLFNNSEMEETDKLKINSSNNFSIFEKRSLNNLTTAEFKGFCNNTNNITSGVIVSAIFLLQSMLAVARYKWRRSFQLKHRWFDIATLVLTFFASFPICLCTNFQTHWNLIVVLNFCASLTLLNYIKRHPRFGVYVIMITYVFASFLRFAPIFIMVLLPVVVLFFVLLGDGNGIFAFFDTFIHTLVMMIGEFDYKDSVSSKDSFITSTMFCLFLFAVTIFLMNLLTGIAVSDTTKILQEAVLRRKIMQIKTIHHVQSSMPEWIKKIYWNGFCKDPKEIYEIEKETHRITTSKFRQLFKWWGMSKDAARQIENGKQHENRHPLETKIDALEQKLDQSVNKLNEKMNDIIKMLAANKQNSVVVQEAVPASTPPVFREISDGRLRYRTKSGRVCQIFHNSS